MSWNSWLVLLFLSLLTAGCSSHERETWPAGETPPASQAVSVTVEPVKKRSVQRTVEAVGTLHGFEEVTISTKVEGIVKSIRHDVADRVAPGEVLLEIDPTDYELAVRQAEKSLEVELAKLGLKETPGPTVDVAEIPPVVQALARLDNAKAKLQRTQTLRQQNVSTAEELADRTADARVAQAEYDNQVLIAKSGVATVRVEQEDLAIAKQQLLDTVIRVPTPSQPMPGADKTKTPVAYAITKRSVSEGTLVRSGTEVFRLVLNKTLKLKAAIPERNSSEVELGQPADILTSAFPQPFRGTVTRINPSVDPETRTFEVEIQVDNSNGQLKAGSFAKVSIITRTDSSATTVPLEAIVSFAGVTKIFLLEDGKAREVQVTLGTQSTDWIEIRDPAVPDGAQVITSGHTNLADGAAAVARKREEPAPKKPAEDSHKK